MSRSERLFLQDMLECARKVVRYTEHLIPIAEPEFINEVYLYRSPSQSSQKYG